MLGNQSELLERTMTQHAEQMIVHIVWTLGRPRRRVQCVLIPAVPGITVCCGVAHG